MTTTDGQRIWVETQFCLGSIWHNCGCSSWSSWDSCTAWWCNPCKHFEDRPAPFKVVCNDAFYTKGNLEEKLVKTQGTHNDKGYATPLDQSLTHLRQCSEWGNNILTGCWRQLRTKLPTTNLAPSQILWACILLHNWRAETVGRNQIKTYFDDITTEVDKHTEGWQFIDKVQVYFNYFGLPMADILSIRLSNLDLKLSTLRSTHFLEIWRASQPCHEMPLQQGWQMHFVAKKTDWLYHSDAWPFFLVSGGQRFPFPSAKLAPLRLWPEEVES